MNKKIKCKIKQVLKSFPFPPVRIYTFLAIALVENNASVICTYMCDTNTNFPIDTRAAFYHLSSTLKEPNTSS
jgi:hypothetical protein